MAHHQLTLTHKQFEFLVKIIFHSVSLSRFQLVVSGFEANNFPWLSMCSFNLQYSFVISSSMNQHLQQKADLVLLTSPSTNQFNNDGTLRILSGHLDKYLKYFENSCLSQTQMVWSKSLTYQPKENNQSSSRKAYQCEVQQQINSSEMMILKVRIARFHLTITLLNIKGPNPLLLHPFSAKGTFGKIYFLKFLQKITSLKIIGISKHASSLSIHRAIKEYSIMKICSTLQCSPKTQPLFGFDLIVYDDSIMFCMQKCNMLNQLNYLQINQLKESLMKMHSYQIMHLDIKPQNIMYSPHFKKIVFVDFGFSEIVQESFGYKTRISFRGSPAYCSDEMSRLLGHDNIADIDLYYNDMHGLQVSLNCIKRKKINRQIYNQCLFADCLTDQQIENHLLLSLLKYRFLCKQTTKILEILMLKKELLLWKYSDEIIHLFECCLSAQQFQRIYAVLDKQINKFIDHKTINRFFKLRYRTFSICTNEYPQLNSSENNNLFRNRLNIYDLTQNLKVSKEKYNQYLQQQGIFNNESLQQQTRHILIEYLRFDIKNNNILDKINISNKFNQASIIDSVKNISNIACIKVTFIFLLEYCLRDASVSWQKDHIFVILSQILILDLNLEPYIQRVFIIMDKIYLSIKDKILCSIQLIKLTYLFTLKHISDHQCMKEVIPYKIYMRARQIILTIVQQHENCTDKQVSSIVKALKIYLNEKKPNTLKSAYLCIKENLQNVTDAPFRIKLLQFLYLQILQVSCLEENYDQINKLLTIIKEFPFYKNFQQKRQVLSYSTYYTSRFLILMKNYKDLHNFLRSVINAINCAQISNKFKFQMCIFAFSSDLDNVKIRQYCLELLSCSKSLLTVKLNSEFMQMIDKIKNSLTFAQQFPQILEKILEQLFDLYGRIETQRQVLLINQVERIMLRHSMMEFLLSRSPIYLNKIFPQKLNQLNQMINSKPVMSIQQQYYYQFHKQLLFVSYCTLTQSDQKLLQAYQNLYLLSQAARTVKAEKYFLKRTIIKAVYNNSSQKLLKYTYLFYNMSHNIVELSRYFEFKQLAFITITLYQFELNNDLEAFYNFLAMLSKFITKFPSLQNIGYWYENLQKLVVRDQYLRLMSFDKLTQNNRFYKWDNHYFILYLMYSLKIEAKQSTKRKIFIKIAQNISFLNEYTKRIILRQYFYSVIKENKGNIRIQKYLLLRQGFRHLEKSTFMRFKRSKALKICQSWISITKMSIVNQKINAALSI